ncbi:hypothetical protein AXG93_4908s1020 [Marchantia polymorpha subsp. ruderalis]|uniref:Uncharacterized protein n=1 Tax=Marchantia polymorpha subsp. ruderalis TaxID=1480154 RepID=A0A176WAC5_MARPO|nr:hypothetical protein AXG93_4908s1020 [Marchantia polymorpha subsp. ruderalis]
MNTEAKIMEARSRGETCQDRTCVVHSNSFVCGNKCTSTRNVQPEGRVRSEQSDSEYSSPSPRASYRLTSSSKLNRSEGKILAVIINGGGIGQALLMMIVIADEWQLVRAQQRNSLTPVTGTDLSRSLGYNALAEEEEHAGEALADFDEARHITIAISNQRNVDILPSISTPIVVRSNNIPEDVLHGN